MKHVLSILLTIAVPIVAIWLLVTGLALASTSTRPLLQDGVPTVVSYQGQVVVDSQPYTGTGYFKFAVVNGTGSATFWSNDGTSTGGDEPTDAVSLTVTNGLFNVLLGDTSLGGGMTQVLSASVFDGPDRSLRVWFSDDNVTFTQLSPDRPIAAVPYALQSEMANDADTVDGMHASAFVTSAHTHDDRYWNLTGNAETVPDTHFLGTTDAVSLTLAVSGTTALRLVPAAGTPNVIGGYSGNSITPGVVGATIGGGGQSCCPNLVTGDYAVLAGGAENTVTGDYSAIGGGRNNTASGEGAFIGGGGYDGSSTAGNQAEAIAATIGGGYGNVVSTTANYGVVVGGINNSAGSNRAFIGGGMLNNTSPFTGYAAIVAGRENEAAGQFSFIGNGYQNQALGFRSAIVGGETNVTHDWFNFIANGDAHEIWGDYSSIGGGYSNIITGELTIIGGGGYHVAEGEASTISGGKGNTTSANYATVPGGWNAAATHYGEMAYANGSFDERGDAQTSVYVLRRNVSGASQRTLFLDPGSNARITLPVSRTITFDILVTAAADNGDAASYQYVGGIKHTTAGGVALIGSVQEVMALEDDSNWSVAIDADDTNDALRIRVTGAADRTIHWVATVRTVETTMP